MASKASSTVSFESTVTIDRPIEEVFARLSKLSEYSSWMHHTGLFGNCRQLSDGPIEKGTEYVDSSRMGRFHGEVTAFEAPSAISFSESLSLFGSKVMEARPAYKLRSENGKTVVAHVAEGELFGAMRAMKPMAGLMARMERSRTLKSLQRSFSRGSD